MEIELISESIRRAGLLCDVSAVVEESGDAVVPDSLPDIIRIVETAAAVEITGKELRGGRVYADALVKGSALYVPETGTGLCKIQLSIPVSHVFDISEATNDINNPVIRMNAELVSAAARELNPRKIASKAAVKFTLDVYAYSELELNGDIEGRESNGVELKRKNITVSVISGLGEKDIVVSDFAELGDIKIEEAELLKYDLTARTTDTKLIPNKIILKGELQTRALLSTPADRRPVTPCETVIMFSGVVECEGITEDSQAEILYRLADTDLQITEETGTNRPLLSLKTNLTVCVKALTELPVTFIEDTYSTSHALEYKKTDIVLTPASKKGAVRVSSKEILPTGVAIKSVYTCAMTAENAAIEKAENGSLAVCQVNVRAIFEAEDGGVYSLVKQIPVTAELDNANGLTVESVFVSEESYHISGSEDIETRFTTEFALSAQKDVKFSQVSSVEIGETLGAKGERPAATLCFCTGEESFWELGKRLKASVSDILGANGLSGDYPPAGKMLLVPRKA